MRPAPRRRGIVVLAWLVGVLVAVLAAVGRPAVAAAAAPPALAQPPGACALTPRGLVEIIDLAPVRPPPLSKSRVRAFPLFAAARDRRSSSDVPGPRWGKGPRYDDLVVGLTVYVNGDPVNLVDPDGHNPCSYEGTGPEGCTAAENKALARSSSPGVGFEMSYQRVEKEHGVEAQIAAATAGLANRATDASEAELQALAAQSRGDAAAYAENIARYDAAAKAYDQEAQRLFTELSDRSVNDLLYDNDSRAKLVALRRAIADEQSLVDQGSLLRSSARSDLRRAATLENGARIARIFGVGVAIVSSSFDAAADYQENSAAPTLKRYAHAAASGVGGLGGGLAGALAGAEAGAACGAGAVICSPLGAFVGGAFGSDLGRAILQSLIDHPPGSSPPGWEDDHLFPPAGY
jgi:hypothetical protein